MDVEDRQKGAGMPDPWVTGPARAAIANQVEATVKGQGLAITGWLDLRFDVDLDPRELALMGAYLDAAQEAQVRGGLLALISFPTGEGQGVLVPVIVQKRRSNGGRPKT